MRFQQQVGIIHQQQQQNQLPRNNCHINGNKNQVTHSGTIFYRSENENNNFSDDKCLKTLKSIIHKSESEHINNFDTNDVNRIERLLKFKTNTCGYFKNFIDTNKQCEDINIDLNGNDNENVLLIETLNLTEDNLSRFVTSTTQATEAYDNCVTNQS
ncbi:hypothetical protein PVAND_004679 [Polypedilum vanderplanki]|uniref:Uncharacterized protein n=1 Tax=Polypedilum vanderplanki TaxID=319348 RepID=A0A9J6BXX7_POLVA|nr:hypothetical protein PVAND_004679 [Polypedilum vanderplanki]